LRGLWKDVGKVKAKYNGVKDVLTKKGELLHFLYSVWRQANLLGGALLFLLCSNLRHKY
jgi:hypothetical protein